MISEQTEMKSYMQHLLLADRVEILLQNWRAGNTVETTLEFQVQVV